MSPRQNDTYASEVSKLLESALGSLSFVERLRYVNCSFPAANANAPVVELLNWNSLDDSEWKLSWAPPWSCEVCVDGRVQVISFSTLLRVAGARVEGRLRLSFSSDLSTLSIRFLEMPDAHVDVTCKVIIGQLPLPIQETMGSLVREVALRWIRENLVSPNKLDLTLHEKKAVSDDDFAAAKRAALIGAARARDHSWGRSVSDSQR
mmetsp:Transcript_1002/g.3987  ORF Transcript_1002/g.3987 Transcript_1002/m.3987 type:complete len:206 (-) Transcript_1002:421-1038(-)